MAACSIVGLGGVNLNAFAPPGVGLRPVAAPYLAFAGPAPGAGSSIDITVALDVPQAAEPAHPLLSNGCGWVLSGSAAGRRLRVASPGAGGQPFLVGEWDRQATRATVYAAQPADRVAPGSEVDHPVHHPLDQMLMMHHLASQRGLLVHAAGLACAAKGLLFPGVSGAGKSTLTRQFLACSWPALLSDERIIVRELSDGFRVYGTPWPGEAGVAANASAALAGIFFLARGDRHCAAALSPRQALERLLPAAAILWYDAELLAEQLATCERLLQQTPAFELRFRPSPDLVDYLDDFSARYL